MTSIDTFAGTGPFSSGYEAGNLSYTTETRGFTVNGQMASQNWSTLSAWDGVTRAIGSLQYFTGLDASLSPTNSGAANGQIAAMVDGVSKETVLYQYDALKRLVAATSTPNAGSTVQSWAQSYQYDGFGNLTAKTLQTGAGAAVTTAIPVTVSTNRLTNASYDANGNMTSGSGVTMGYDEANRIASVMPTSGGAEYYGYAPDNKRVYRLNPATGVEELTLYGARGEKLAKFSVNGNTMSPAGAFVWFGGKMVGPGMAQQDRLGTNRGGGRFYPYGEQIGSATGTDGVQFATYRRDGVSGLDYADQRYYASTYGRFNTPDPYSGSADPNDPKRWNRYAYVHGDPVNSNDPGGRVGSGGCGSEDGPAECALDDGTAYAWTGNSGGNGATGGIPDPCIQIILGFQAPPGSVACTTAVIAIISPPERTAPTPECPLISLIGNYRTTGGVVALFAPDLAYILDAALTTLNNEGVIPVITDGFRTFADQKARYENSISGKSPYPAARPGTGVHEIGEAVDFGLNANGANSALIQAALKDLLTWGGTWKGRQYDPVHFETVHTPSRSQLAACEREHP